MFALRTCLIDDSLRHICHGWPDPTVATILKQLRKAAQPQTRLIVHDMIMQFACTEPETGFAGREISESPPEPLLANWGRANSEMYSMDMLVSRVFDFPVLLY